MDKETYLRFLRSLLATRLPEREVEDIIRYYTEYFEEAGPEREKEVMASLGSPEVLAKQIVEQRQAEEAPAPAVPQKRRVQLWQILLIVGAVIFVTRLGVKFVVNTVGRVFQEAVAPAETTVIEQVDFVSVPGTAGKGSTADADDGYIYFPDLPAFQTVKIDVDFADVSVYNGSGADFALELVNGGLEGGDLEFEVENGVLTVSSTKAVEVFPNLDAVDRRVSLTIPEGHALEDVVIHTKLGDVDWSAVSEARSLDLSTNLGEVTCYERIAAQELEMHSDMGDIYVSNGGGDPSQISDAKLTTSMGDVSVYNVSAGELTAETSMGDISLYIEQDPSEVNYDLTTDMGEVWVDNDLRRTSARQEGREGAPSITAHTSMGDVSLDKYEG